MPRTDGAAVYCPVCEHKFGGMVRCPWDDARLLPLPDADPIALAFYAAITEGESMADQPVHFRYHDAVNALIGNHRWRYERVMRSEVEEAARALAARGYDEFSWRSLVPYAPWRDVCTCGNGEAEDDRGAVLRCAVHRPAPLRERNARLRHLSYMRQRGEDY